MSVFGRTAKSVVVGALGGPGSRLTTLVRAGMGRREAIDMIKSWRAAEAATIVDEPGASASSADAAAAERERLATLAKVEFANGRLPTNFSIILGAAPCNHSCLFCPQSIHKPKKAQWLDLDLLRKVLSEMPEEGIHLNIASYSETLAAPNLVPAVRLMKEVRPKLPISMATNGSLFREKVVEGLIDAGLDYYQYSLDAPTKETYAKLIQKDDFEIVIENLRKLIKLRDSKNSNMIVLSHLMEFRETEEKNKKTMSMLREFFSEKDVVDIRRVANWGGGPWNLEENLKKAGFTAKYEPPATRFPCTSLLMHFKLQGHGDYVPCVAAVPDYTVEEELHDVPTLGNAADVTWMEAWQKMDEMRRAHLEGRWDDYECCRNCNIWGLWQNFWDDHGETTPDQPRFTVVGDAPHIGDGKAIN